MPRRRKLRCARFVLASARERLRLKLLQTDLAWLKNVLHLLCGGHLIVDLGHGFQVLTNQSLVQGDYAVRRGLPPLLARK